MDVEKTLVALVLIALMTGLGGGYGLGYTIYQPQNQNLQEALDNLNGKLETINSTLTETRSSITSLQNELSTLNSEVANLNSTVEKMANKTWHFVKNFIINTTKGWGGVYWGPTSRFFIQGDKWRVKWALGGNLTEYFVGTLVRNVTYSGWTGLVINDENGSVNTFSIPIGELVFTLGDPPYVSTSAERTIILYKNIINGLFYVTQGESEFHVSVYGIRTPLNLTIESYH